MVWEDVSNPKEFLRILGKRHMILGVVWQKSHEREPDMLARVFLDHPAKVDETFFQHMLFALKFSGMLFAAAAAALVHALIPCLFEKTASGIIARLYERTHARG